MLSDHTPALSVVTVPAPEALTGDLLEYTSAATPLAWLRAGDGFVGVGEALRWEGSGPERFAAARRWWASLSAAATVDNSVDARGSGLVAFGTFAFSASSMTSSALIVPRMIIGRSGGVAWVTIVSLADEPSSRPSAVPIRPGSPIDFVDGAMAGPAYRDAIQEGLRRISRGEVEKVVLARELTATLPADTDARWPLSRLADSYPDCWTFAVDGLLGATPEMLARVDGGTVRARVLAGSTGRGTDAASDASAALTLATSEKDRDEHGYAVRSVLSALAPHTSSLVSSDQPFTLKLPNLWHLASDVEGRLSDGSSSLDMADALHPTAAVAGTPTREALAMIDELEAFDRGRYAGPVGWVDADGDGAWGIALRCAQVTSGRVTAYAGAGVVTGSEAQRELAETGMKFKPIIDAFS